MTEREFAAIHRSAPLGTATRRPPRRDPFLTIKPSPIRFNWHPEASPSRLVTERYPGHINDMNSQYRKPSPPSNTADPVPSPSRAVPAPAPLAPEIGGPKGPEPTRYGDWEQNGRCTDF
jgi:hypothetical protein